MTMLLLLYAIKTAAVNYDLFLPPRVQVIHIKADKKKRIK